MVQKEHDDQNNKGFMPMEMTFIFRNIEGYIPSGLGAIG